MGTNLIRLGSITPKKFYFKGVEVKKMYKGSLLIFDNAGGVIPLAPCFDVVDNISQYTDTKWVDVYDKKTAKWYKLNNLNKYEEYGVYATDTSDSVTTYTGKLAAKDGKEYKYDGKQWIYVGNVTSKGLISIDLNGQWLESTKKLDGYHVYMSNSNKGVNSSTAVFTININGKPNFKLYINSYAESRYDYTKAYELDSTTSIKANTSGAQYDPTDISKFTKVDYPNDGGSHFVRIEYSKDSSGNSYDDRGYCAIADSDMMTNIYAIEYDKKVAPPDDVEYDTLDSLKLMECPWVGMKAYITTEKKWYVFTSDNEWVQRSQIKQPIDFEPKNNSIMSYGYSTKPTYNPYTVNYVTSYESIPSDAIYLWFRPKENKTPNLKISGYGLKYGNAMFTTMSSGYYREIDVTDLNTSSFETFSQMFGIEADKFTSIKGLKYLDTSNVTDMSYALVHNNYNLTRFENNLDLSKWDTSKVTNMEYMFYESNSNKGYYTGYINLIGWDTSKVTNMGGMFSGQYKLSEIKGTEGWDVSNVTNMNNMFYNCHALTTLNLSGWDVSKVTDMNGMFYSCQALTTFILKNMPNDSMFKLLANQTSYIKNATLHVDEASNALIDSSTRSTFTSNGITIVVE